MAKTNHGRFATTLTAIAIASLTACGGGGGSGTVVIPNPQPTTCSNGAGNYPTCTPAPRFTSVVMTPATGATGVSVNTNVQMAFAVDGTLVPGTSKMDASCKKSDGTTVVIAGNATIGATTWTFTPSAQLPYSATCTVSNGGTFTNAGGLPTTLPTATATTTFSTAAGPSCTAPATWNAGIKICENPSDVPLVGFNQLPAGCDDRPQKCWDVAKENGTVKAIKSEALDGAGQPVTMLVFKSVPSGFTVILPVRSADGSPTTNSVGVLSNPSNIWGGITNEVIAVKGSKNGAIVKMKVGLSTEFHEYTLNKETNQWLLVGNVFTGPSF